VIVVTNLSDFRTVRESLRNGGNLILFIPSYRRFEMDLVRSYFDSIYALHVSLMKDISDIYFKVRFGCSLFLFTILFVFLHYEIDFSRLV
jgi:hypothetical protein